MSMKYINKVKINEERISNNQANYDRYEIEILNKWGESETYVDFFIFDKQNNELEVNEIKIFDKRIPISFDGFRIVQLSDFHNTTLGKENATEEEIQQRYNNNQFLPCSINKWQLSEEAYRVAIKAVSPDRNERYLTFAEFWNEWKKAL